MDPYLRAASMRSFLTMPYSEKDNRPMTTSITTVKGKVYPDFA